MHPQIILTYGPAYGPFFADQVPFAVQIHVDALLSFPEEGTFVPVVYQQQLLAMAVLQELGPTRKKVGWH